MLRKMLSPRQQEGRRDREKQRSNSELQLNGHRRQGSDGEEVTNHSYGDPDKFTDTNKFNPPARSQSLIGSPTTTGNEGNPPLPRRNERNITRGGSMISSKQLATENPEGEASLYVTPPDTFKRDQANSGEALGESQPTRNELRQFHMHQLTMSQVRGQSPGICAAGAPVGGGAGNNGHQRTRSFGHVIENSVYSVPFNQISTGASEGVRPVTVRPPNKHRDRHGQASVENSERIITINLPSSTSPQPPSDRSDTNSPNSPSSYQSCEQDPPRLDDGTSDYAEPWDSSKIFPNRNKSKSREDNQFQRRMDEHRPRGGSTRVSSSPPPSMRGATRFQSARAHHVGEGSPPPPELPYDPRRNRGFSERAHPPSRDQEGSTSPVNIGGRMQALSMEKSQPFEMDDLGHHHSQSTSSHHRVGRRLPTPPHDPPPKEPPPLPWQEPPPPPPPKDSREEWKINNALNIDVSIPLEDQP